MPMKKIGASAGFTLRNVGGVVIVGGSCFSAAEIADCTSSAAASMLRSSVNCSVIWVWPMPLTEVIESSDGIVENCFSSGVATADAIVSGEAPGNVALTWIVGKSTFGRSDTGSSRYATDAEHEDADHDQRRHDRAGVTKISETFIVDACSKSRRRHRFAGLVGFVGTLTCRRRRGATGHR